MTNSEKSSGVGSKMEENFESMINQMQAHNQQLQTIMIQKQSVMLQNKEIESALDFLGKMEGDEVYKTVGPILVKTGKVEVIKELEENKEELDMKIKALQNQEKKIKERLKEGQEKFQEMAKHIGHGG